MSGERYIVYWARLAKHDDPYSEGYIGISRNTLAQRKRSHYKAAKRNKETNNHFHNALKRYGKTVIWEVIHDNLAEDDAFTLEGDYRPQIELGWNTDKGGIKAVSPEWYADEANKQRHSEATAEATRRRIAEKDTPEARAARARAIWADEEYRKSREGMSAGENNPQFGKFGKDHPAAGHTKTPEGLAAISAAHKGKVMSRETRHKLSEAKSKFTPEQRAEMYKRRCAGDTPTKIAEYFETNADAVDANIRRHWKTNKLPKPKPLDELNPDWRKYTKADEPNAYRGSNARASKFTQHEREDICARRMEGETYSSIGKSYGKGVSTIRNVCKVWGPENGYPFLEIIGEKQQSYTREQKAEMCQRRADGETFEAIATAYGATLQNVHSICSIWGPKNGFPFTKTYDGNSTT